MKRVYILTNALDYGDAVSTHCILLKELAQQLGHEAYLVAPHAHERLRCQVDMDPDRLQAEAENDDILLHQMFNETALLELVQRFPGRRILMYHNITPPRFFAKGTPVYDSCANGLKQMRLLRFSYDLALGMTEFSRQDLLQLGYERTGVFPLLVDVDGLRTRPANPLLLCLNRAHGTTLLFVGRMAPNKRLEDLLRLFAEYKRLAPRAFLRVVGNDRQHPGYVAHLREIALGLALREGDEFELCGKIPDEDLIAHYRTADGYISLSEHEGFCAPLVEAMAFRLPVFYYDAGGCAEAAGGTGVIFREKDWAAMADRIHAVLSDPDKRAAVVGQQLRWLEEFGMDRQRKRVGRLLEEIAALEPRARRKPRVSVVINTYNRARQLDRCLASLQQQTYPDFEVIVVNGPSTDHTEAVLAKYRSVVRVERTTHRNISVSRNVGIAASSGDLVAFLDDDAVPDRCWLEALTSAFCCPEVGAAGGLVYRLGGRDIEFRNGVIDRDGFVDWNREWPGLYWDEEGEFVNTVSGNNCIFRREALDKIGGFDESIEYYHDEADVVVRLLRHGYITVHRPSAVVYHEAARSNNRQNAYQLNWYAICKNTVYFALKNELAHRSRWLRAASVVGKVLRQRIAPMLLWALQGHIGKLVLCGMVLRGLVGILAGCVKGFRRSGKERALLHSPSASANPAFSARPRGSPSVCLLTQDLPQTRPGGIATYSLALARGLRDLGCEVHVVSRGELRAPEQREGIWFHWAKEADPSGLMPVQGAHPTLAKNLGYTLGVHDVLQDIEARWGVDVIESPNWDFEGLAAAVQHHHPMVVRAHSPLFQVASMQGWPLTEDLQLCTEMEGVLYRHADAVTGSTQAVLDLVSSRYPISDKCALVPLGLDIPAHAEEREQGSDLRILFVGRLEPRKGIRTLLDAIPIMDAEVPGVRIDIVGKDCGGPAGLAWKDWWNANHASSVKNVKVHFHGEVGQEELVRFYETCSIFVAPSLYESFGLIYLEAMARAKPVVACAVGGVPEVVLHEVTGLLVAPDDPQALAASLVRLIKDPQLRNRLGEAGKARYGARFTTTAMAKATLELYNRLLRAWREEEHVIWRGSALQLRRTGECEVRWDEMAGVPYVLIPAGSPGTQIYGPYVSIPEGTYMAQFKLSLAAAPLPHAHIATADLFSLRAGTLTSRLIRASDFTLLGQVFDLPFTCPPGGVEDCEFRLSSSGAVPLRVREIVVKALRHPSLKRAMFPADRKGSVAAQHQEQDR